MAPHICGAIRPWPPPVARAPVGQLRYIRVRFSSCPVAVFRPPSPGLAHRRPRSRSGLTSSPDTHARLHTAVRTLPGAPALTAAPTAKFSAFALEPFPELLLGETSRVSSPSPSPGTGFSLRTGTCWSWPPKQGNAREDGSVTPRALGNRAVAVGGAGLAARSSALAVRQPRAPVVRRLPGHGCRSHLPEGDVQPR